MVIFSAEFIILTMIDYNFAPTTYFDSEATAALLVKLSYPESQWGAEISIYVSQEDGVYYFEAVDFFGNEFYLKPKKSIDPLTLKELIAMVEGLDFNPNYTEGNIELTLMGIPVAESKHYPEIALYFSEKRSNFGLN